MKRSGFLRREKVMARRAILKSSRPKSTAIRRSARGEECTLNFDGVCSYDSSTVVLCHSNELADGKGMGLKAPDTAACYGCASCHDVLDGRRPRPSWLTYEMMLQRFREAVVATHARLRAKGLM